MQNNTENLQSERREIALLWLTARTLIQIDGTLSDIRTLHQQQVDLLRRLVEGSAV